MTYREQTKKLGLKEWRRYPGELGVSAWKELQKEELEDLKRVIERAYNEDLKGAHRALRDFAVTRYRLRKKARRDAETDARTRVLVGARLPRETAERVKEAAQAEGKSVYRWVRDAIEKALDGVPF